MEIKNLTFSYQGKHVFQDFSMTIPSQKITCILGRSGIGKSTLLQLIAGIKTPKLGMITHRNHPTNDCKISYIFQEHRLLPWKTALENVEFVLFNSYEQVKRKELAKQMLMAVGLEQDLHAFPHELSGGMRQRVSIARAFAVNPDILLLDEPLQGLDITTRGEIQRLFLKLYQEYNPTVVYVTHDLEDALMVADCIVVFAYQPVYIGFDECINISIYERDKDPQIQDIRQRLYKHMGHIGK
ncbi:hypothetical protein BHU72_13760 [Desulfuribacillus stibiiarsenatis]|uniref:ABC transporter domain-containing protein n=1 Tax=Desulfuribacillus stibiiarsenatis TaxID=1390249 RepID=A0A1E5L7Z8_9FIRM|nr:ABC transporter ATP-binding protein [Desulfuribacillus stibiiarsenatis]OEH86287.1 hypothetical protein BHU72_13760 [Desulfuribacillus stibiiarsenatis]